MELNEFMSNMIEFFFNLALIIVIIAVIYAVIWTAIFIPIIKLRKHTEKVRESNREYNQIESDIGAAEIARSNNDEKITKQLLTIHYKKVEEKEIRERIKQLELREQRLIKQTKDKDNAADDETLKRGPGRPPKTDNNTADNESVEKPKKRGPGRPRKKP